MPRRTLFAPRGSRAQDLFTSAWHWAGLGGGLGLLWALWVWAPAHWLTWGVTQVSQGRVLMPAARGSVWQGSAQLLLSGGQGSLDALALPGRIHWHIVPGWLSVRLGLQTDCCMSTTTDVVLRVSLSGLSLAVDSHSSQWPAALLGGLGTPWNTLKPEGQLQLHTDAWGLIWRKGQLNVQGLVTLKAQNMTSRLSTLKPMGSYQIQLEGSAEGSPTPRLKLSTTQGPLLLLGHGQWVNGRLRFTGEARANEDSENALSNLLNIIGRREGARSLLSLE